jgi:hypothetical protein
MMHMNANLILCEIWQEAGRPVYAAARCCYKPFSAYPPLLLKKSFAASM